MTIKSSSLEKTRAQITLCDHSNIRSQNIASIASYKDNFCPSKNIVPQRTSNRLLWIPGIVFGLFSICGHSTVKPNRIADESETNINFIGERLDISDPEDGEGETKATTGNADGDIGIDEVNDEFNITVHKSSFDISEFNMNNFLNKNAHRGKILVFLLADSHGFAQSYAPVVAHLREALDVVNNRCPVALVISGDLQSKYTSVPLVLNGRKSSGEQVELSSPDTRDWLKELKTLFNGNVFVAFGNHDLHSLQDDEDVTAGVSSYLNNCNDDNINILFNLKHGLQEKFQRGNIHHGCILGNTLFFPYSMNFPTHRDPQVNNIFKRDYSTALFNFDIDRERKGYPDQLLRDFGKVYSSGRLSCRGLSYTPRLTLSSHAATVRSIQNEYTPWEVNGSPNRAALDTAYLLKLSLEDLARKNPTGTLNVVFAAHEHRTKVLVFVERMTELFSIVRVSPDIIKRLRFGLACGHYHHLYAVKKNAYMTAEDNKRYGIPYTAVAPSIYNKYICGFALDHAGSDTVEVFSKDDDLAKFTATQEDTTNPEYLPKLFESVFMTAKVALRRHYSFSEELELWDCANLKGIADHLKIGGSLKNATLAINDFANKNLFDLLSGFLLYPSTFDPMNRSYFDTLRQYKYEDGTKCRFDYCAQFPVFFWFTVFSELCRAIDHFPDEFREYRQNLAYLIRRCLDVAKIVTCEGSNKYRSALVRSIHCMQSDAGSTPPKALAPLWESVARAKECVQKANGKPVVCANMSEWDRLILKDCAKIYENQQNVAKK
ncbi:MAG: hypothetical protein LBR89_01330 [Holosporales bacterium]|jgi:hypothetical protein|nr:hypothetical protein [Holosporales bacterium]